MYTCIYIYPNSTDDWSTSEGTPFVGYTLPSGKCFALSTITTAQSTPNFVLVSGKLTHIGDISRDVDIFGKVDKIISGELKVKGVGGTARTSDFEFILENFTDTIKRYKLLGRTVKVCLSYTHTSIQNYSDDLAIFAGKINSMRADKLGLAFTCRGFFQDIKDSELGQIVGINQSISTSKVYPITYGSHMGKDDFMPIAIVEEEQEITKLYLGEVANKSIDNLSCFDPSTARSYKVKDPTQINKSADFSYIKLEENKTSYLVSTCTSYATDINIFSPEVRLFSIPSTPTLSAGDIYSITVSSFTYMLEYLQKEDDLYVFTCYYDYLVDANPIPSAGTLSRAAGTGPSTLAFDACIGSISWFLERHYGLEYVDEGDSCVSAKPSQKTIRIDDEIIEVIAVTHVYSDSAPYPYRYMYSICTCVRGSSGSSAASHTTNAIVYLIGDKINSKRWLAGDFFWPSKINNLSYFSDQISRKAEISYIDNLTRMHTNKLDYEDTDEGYYTRIVLDDIYASSNTGSVFNIELDFPANGLDCEIANIYSVGYYSSYSDVLSVGIAWNHSSLLFALGSNAFRTIFINGMSAQRVLGYSGAILNSANIYSDFAINLVGIGSMTSMYRYLSGGLPLEGTWFYSSNLYNATKNMGIKNMKLNMFGEDTSNTYPNYTFKQGIKIKNLNSLSSERLMLSLFMANLLGVSISPVYPLTGNFTDFRIADPGLYIEFYIDPFKVPAWAKGEGRIDSSDSLITNPVSQIEDILKTELGLTDSDMDQDSLTAAKTARQNWQTSFSIYKGVEKVDSFLGRICKEVGLIISETGSGKLFFSAITPPDSTVGLYQFTDDILARDSRDLVEWEEEYTTIDNLYTYLDILYSLRYPDDVFTLSMSSDNIPGADDLLSNAKGIIGKDKKATLELEFIRDSNTVQYSSNLAMVYNSVPIRILTLTTTLVTSYKNLGEWVTIDSNYISEVANKLYLMIGYQIQPGYLEVAPECKITLLELPSDISDSIIQEVPLAMTESWGETYSGSEEIGEIV